MKVRNLEGEFGKRPLLAFADAKSLEATVTKDAGQLSDKRVKILVSQIKEILNEGIPPKKVRPRFTGVTRRKWLPMC